MINIKTYIRKFLLKIDSLIPVYARDRILAAFSNDGVNWEKHNKPIVDVGNKSHIDMAYWPFVWKEKDKWYMVYFGSLNLRKNPGYGSIYFAQSNDGLNWHEHIDLFEKHENTTHNIYRFCPRIIKTDKSYFLLYIEKQISNNSKVRFYFKKKEFDILNKKLKENTALFLTKDSIKMLLEKGYKVLPDFSTFQVDDKAIMILTAQDKDSNTCFLICEYQIKNNKIIPLTSWKPDIPKATIINNPTITKTKNGFFLYFRVSFRSAWGSTIWLATSKDLKHFKIKGKVLDYNGKYELGGVGFPHILSTSNKLLLFYGGYWGIHLLMPYTYYKRR